MTGLQNQTVNLVPAQIIVIWEFSFIPPSSGSSGGSLIFYGKSQNADTYTINVEGQLAPSSTLASPTWNPGDNLYWRYESANGGQLSGNQVLYAGQNQVFIFNTFD